jgi:hypothetical protein
MNWNPTTVAFAISALGALTVLDIIPGAGFYPGLVMLAIGAATLVVQLIERSSLPWAKSRPNPSQATEAMTISSSGCATARMIAAMVLVAGIAGAPTASAQDWMAPRAGDGATRA